MNGLFQEYGSLLIECMIGAVVLAMIFNMLGGFGEVAQEYMTGIFGG